MATGYTGRSWALAAAMTTVIGLSVGAAAAPQSAGVTNAGQTIAVDRDGDFVRVRTPGQQVDASNDGWRKKVTVTRGDSDALLTELGAREADGAIRVALSGDILFDFNSSAIRPAASETLAKIAQVIRDRSRGDVYVVGHTDSVGSDAYNQKLSEERAAAVIAWLNRQEGIPASLMLGRGMGKTQPVAYNTLPNGADNPEGRAQNRRVEVLLATREGVDLRNVIEVPRVNTGGSDIVVERSADRQTVQVGGRTIDVQQGAAGQRVQVGDTVVDVGQAASARSGANTTAAAGAPATGSRPLRSNPPVQCSGTRVLELDGVMIDTPGTAIEASGTCKIILRNSEVRSGGVAIAASGMSNIDIIDSVVVGRITAVGASGTAVVSAQGSEFRGALNRSGLATFNDRGRNRLP
jgi:outer membrane protein OmpA-like peptidoglycan-associated protein